VIPAPEVAQETGADPIQHQGSPALAGVRAILPLAAGVFPIGLVYGAVVAESSFTDIAGFLASPLIFAGAAQLALIDLTEDGAPWIIAVVTALVINLRHVMYSGALAPAFTQFPARWRIPLAYFMTDQVAVTSLLYFDRETDQGRRLRFYLGVGLFFLATWTTGTAVGIVIGATIPPELQLGFAIPLMFIALLIPSVRNRGSVVAAAVGFAVTILAQDAPLNTGLLIGAATGIAFGMLAKR
jgi:4-azaleucine resistance transporter AzlC